jgi:hypothetical protein
MRALSRLSRGGKVLVAVAVAGAAFGLATAVQASIPDASGVVHACYNTSLAHGSPTGALRAIDTSSPSGNCASWEGSVDLATPQFVRNTVNQTSFATYTTFAYPTGGDWSTLWSCPTGYIATNPWIQTNQFFGDNIRFTVRSVTSGGNSWNGTGVVAGQPPNNTADMYYNISGATATVAAAQSITCVDGRVYGEAGPASPPTSPVKATAETKYLGQ